MAWNLDTEFWTSAEIKLEFRIERPHIYKEISFIEENQHNNCMNIWDGNHRLLSWVLLVY
jgi:hypothetical protein